MIAPRVTREPRGICDVLARWISLATEFIDPRVMLDYRRRLGGMLE